MIPIICLVLPVMTEAKPADPKYFSDGPYCGIYCVYSAARMHGRAPSFENLLSQGYVESYKGSTVGQLQDAATQLGLVATAYDGLTIASLRSSTHPVILHVRRPGFRMPYSHWVLYAGIENGFARIVDPPGGVELIPFAELAAYWDGIGVAVSTEPLAPTEFRSTAWLESVVLFLGVAALLAVARKVRTPNDWRKHLVSAGAILAIGCVVGVGSHWVRDDGFYRNSDATGLVAGQHFEPRIEELSYEDMKLISGGVPVTIVDARDRADYEYGHLPGAVNLPVSSGLAERRRLASALPAGRRVIVYCQSSGCKWADSVAADLYNRGFADIALFRGGWQEWDGHE